MPSSLAEPSASSSLAPSRPGTSEVVQQLHDNRALWVRKGIEKGTASQELAQISQQIQSEFHGEEPAVPTAQLQANGDVDWRRTSEAARVKKQLKAGAGHGDMRLQPASSSDKIMSGSTELLLSGGASQAHVDVQETDTGDMKVLRVESSIKVYQSSMQDAVRLEHEIQRRMRLATSGRKHAWRQGELIGDATHMAASPTNLARVTGMQYERMRRQSKATVAKYSGQAYDNYVSLA